MRDKPMRWPIGGARLWEMHASEMHACEMHAYEMHAYEMHAYEMIRL